MKIYADTFVGTDGAVYSRRFLLSLEEYTHLQKVGGLSAQVCEVLGMEQVAEVALAQIVYECHKLNGGAIQ
jgi:hypothetical protein